MINRLYDEPKSRANSVDVLIHDSFYNRCFACIIQSPFALSTSAQKTNKGRFLPGFLLIATYKSTYSINILISLSFSRAFLKIDNISLGS